MTDNEMQEVLALYPSLASVTPTLLDLPVTCGLHQAPVGAVLFMEHQACQGFPLVLQGEIKVFQSALDGRSLELYRVAAGELCLASSASLFRQLPLIATGVTTEQARFLVVTPDVFEAWLAHPAFRADILGLFSQRMMDLSALVNAVAFQKLDQRLAAVLLNAGGDVFVSHQVLAEQLGTVREMITRILRRFEQQGVVQLAREHIRIVDVEALKIIAAV